MAKIFTNTEPPTLDYAAAAAALKRGHEVAVVEAAALLDIAASLNRLVQIAEGADFNDLGDGDDADDDGFEPDARPLDIDDRVTATVDDVTSSGVITALGQSEGTDWADVSWDVDKGEDEFTTRVWLTELTREAAAEQGDDVDADFEAPGKAKSKGKGGKKAKAAAAIDEDDDEKGGD